MNTKFRRVVSILLTIIMLLSASSLSAFATGSVADITYAVTKVPVASFVSSGVTRVAKEANSLELGNIIVPATPSGVPALEGVDNAELMYADETPANTKMTLTLDVTPEKVPTASCAGVILSEKPVVAGNTYTWEILGGVANAGSTLDVVASYTYNGLQFETHGFSYVMDIATGGAHSVTAHMINTAGTTHRYYAVNAINSRILGSNVVYSYSGDELGYYDVATGLYKASDNAGYKTSLFQDIEKRESLFESNNDSTHFATPSSKAVADIYVDLSTQTSLADTNVRLSLISANKNGSQINASKENKEYLGSDSTFVSTAVVGGLADAQFVENDMTASSKINYSISVSGSESFGKNTTIANAPFLGKISNISDGESFTIMNVFKAQNEESWYYKISNTSVTPTYLTVHKYDKSELRNTINYVMNTSTDSPVYNRTVGKGVNPQPWYYSAGYPEFITALKNANGINQKIDATQTEINNAVSALRLAYSKLVMEKADYEYIDILLSVVAVYEENFPSYNPLQVEKLKAAVADIERNYHILAKPMVDEMSSNLYKAMEEMSLLRADYTEIVEAIKLQPEYDESYYTAESYKAWTDLVAEGQDIIDNETINYYEQELVHEKAEEIVNALNSLIFAPADFTSLQTAMAIVVHSEDKYTDADAYATWKSLYEDAEAMVQREDLTVLDNGSVDELANKLTAAAEALVLKGADTSALEAEIAKFETINPDYCSAASYKNYEDAVNTAKTFLESSYTILEQDKVDAMTKTVTDAFDALELKPANKALLRIALMLSPTESEEYYTEESYAAFISAYNTASELYNDSTLTILDNERITTAANNLYDAFDALEIKDADTSALIAALEAEVDDESTYTAETYKPYADAVAAANVLLDTNPSIFDQDLVDEATKAVTEAYNALEKIPMVFEVAEGTATVIDDENGFIYGLEEGITDLEDYVHYYGCELVYTPTDAGFGTGTKVEVVFGGETIKEYVIVIFGDVTGDGYIDSFDVSLLSSISNFESELEEGSAFELAGDITGDGFIDSFDVALLTSASNFEAEIPQTK